MAIKKKIKDQRPSLIAEGGGLQLAEALDLPQSSDPLMFWTNHPTQNCEVDLREFATGKTERRRNGGIWKGPFAGRPQLIAELAPHIKARLQLLSPDSVKNTYDSLRIWWRLFDSLEDKAKTPQFADVFSSHNEFPIEVSVKCVADLHAIHEAVAHEAGVREKPFRTFLNVADDARRSLGLSALAWITNEDADPVRNIPGEQQAIQIKHAIKTEWRRVLESWRRDDDVVARAQASLSGSGGIDPAGTDAASVLNAIYYLQTQARNGTELPSSDELYDGELPSTFNRRGFNIFDMRDLFYPTAREADVAFHLCTLGSGWNPSTVGRLDAGAPSLVRPHPKRLNIEVLEALEVEEGEVAEISAVKPRARGAAQFSTGLLKDECSPPAIVRAFMGRTLALRRELAKQLSQEAVALQLLAKKGTATEEYKKKFIKVQAMRAGLRCVWLYLGERGEILWLDGLKTLRYGSGNGSSDKITYLQDLIVRLNTENDSRGRPQLLPIVPSDFRDLFARWVYAKSGGSILAVMMALGHKSLRSTEKYVKNNVFSDEADWAYLRFAEALLEELRRGRMDLTILTHIVRYGELTEKMEMRLAEYRQLLRSRTNNACEAPRRPPLHIEPEHVEGKLCGKQRCMHSCPNARFLPESMEGMAMRVEELLAMQEALPRQAWLAAEFEDELRNAEILMSNLFRLGDVAKARLRWRTKISSGSHLIPELGALRVPREAEPTEDAA